MKKTTHYKVIEQIADHGDKTFVHYAVCGYRYAHWTGYKLDYLSKLEAHLTAASMNLALRLTRKFQRVDRLHADITATANHARWIESSYRTNPDDLPF